jgi:hypothetical protein
MLFLRPSFATLSSEFAAADLEDFGAQRVGAALLFRSKRGIFSPEKSFSLPDAAKEN